MSPRISIRLLPAQSDERLLRLVREGHERAFEALMNRYRRPLLRYCHRVGLSEARAEDVVQVAFLKAWLAIHSGSEVRELKPWLYRIAHNGALNAMRGASERNTALSENVAASVGQKGEEHLESRIAVCDALAEVASLPARQRQALVLTAINGNTHDEVAGLLGVNEDAVRGLLYRARTTLRSAAAVTPQPFLGWISASADTAVPTAARLPGLAAGGGVLGLSGAVLKGAAVAITAGAVAAGAAAVRLHDRAAHRPPARTLAATITPTRGDPASTTSDATSRFVSMAKPMRLPAHVVARRSGDGAPLSPSLLNGAHAPVGRDGERLAANTSGGGSRGARDDAAGQTSSAAAGGRDGPHGATRSPSSEDQLPVESGRPAGGAEERPTGAAQAAADRAVGSRAQAESPNEAAPGLGAGAGSSGADSARRTDH